MFNPINGVSGATSSNQEFLDQISEKIDSTNDLLDELKRLRDENELIKENVESSCQPLDELGDREVLLDELESILSTLNAVNDDIGTSEADVGPK